MRAKDDQPAIDRVKSGAIIPTAFCLAALAVACLMAAACGRREHEGANAAGPTLAAKSAADNSEQRPGIDQMWKQQDRIVHEHLNGYGWVDRANGVLHIPIDRAIDLLLAEKKSSGPLKSSSSANAPATTATAPAPTNQVAAAAASASSPATPQAAPPVSTNAPATAPAAPAPTNQVAASAAPAASPATPEASQTNTTSSAANAQEGSGLFASAGCVACHKIAGKGGVVGPDLSNEAKLGRSSQWLIQQITDPAKHNPSTKMPANKNLTQPQLKSLADFILNPIAGGGGVTATTPGLSEGSQLATDSTDWRMQLFPERRKNPMRTNPTTVKAGEAIYQGNCLACHGPTGKGDGVAAIAMSKSIPDLSASPMWAYSDGQLFGKITKGQGEMPKFEALLVDTQRWEVVNYIRTLAPKPSGFLTNAPEAAPSVSTNAPAAASAATVPTNQIAASAASAPGPAKPQAATPPSTNALASAPAAPAPTNQIATSAAPAARPAKPEAATPPSTNALASAPAAPAPTNQVAASATPAASPATPEASQTNTASSTANAQEGSGLFASAGCVACHKIAGKGGVVGPDLSQAAKLGRSSQWLIEQITDPAKHNPSTKMPANKSLTQPQLKSLADFILNPSSSPAAPGADTKSNAEKPPSASAAQPAQEKPNTTNTSPTSAQPPVGAQAAQRTGRELMLQYGCTACHDPAAINHAPSLIGIYGRRVRLSDGTFVRADDQYLHDSIMLPAKQVVAGYAPTMPAYGSVIPEADVRELIAYLKSTSAPQPAPKPPASH